MQQYTKLHDVECPRTVLNFGNRLYTNLIIRIVIFKGRESTMSPEQSFQSRNIDELYRSLGVWGRYQLIQFITAKLLTWPASNHLFSIWYLGETPFAFAKCLKCICLKFFSNDIIYLFCFIFTAMVLSKISLHHEQEIISSKF